MPLPGSSRAGPIWSKKMNGPIVVRARCGSVRWTLKPPRSWVVGSSVSRKGSSVIRPPYRHSSESWNLGFLDCDELTFHRRARPDRQRVDAVAEQVGERGVDRALALE